MSGKNKTRPQFTKMVDQLRMDDTVVVWKLDRLGRSLKDLIELVSSFREKGVEFVSLKDGIDTGTATGRLHFTFNIFTSLAEFEREIIRERTMAGLEIMIALIFGNNKYMFRVELFNCIDQILTSGHISNQDARTC